MPLSTLRKPNLVIVRAGKKSLHRGWLDQAPNSRNFDTIVSYFDEEAYDSHINEDAVERYFIKGGKWDGLYKTIKAFEELLENYDYIWMPDDDIACSGQTVNQLFELMRNYDVKVGQPSLTHNSYFTHFLFMQCPNFHIRYTNFVEVMVPCLHKDTLKMILPEFSQTMSGFGLDYIWCRLQGVGYSGAAIFDDIAVHHTRPVGNVLMSTMKKDGVHPKDEERALCDRYGVDMQTTPLAYAGLLRSGKKVSGRASMGFKMLGGYLSSISKREVKERQFGISKLVQLIRRQLTRRIDLDEVSSSL